MGNLCLYIAYLHPPSLSFIKLCFYCFPSDLFVFLFPLLLSPTAAPCSASCLNISFHSVLRSVIAVQMNQNMGKKQTSSRPLIVLWGLGSAISRNTLPRKVTTSTQKICHSAHHRREEPHVSLSKQPPFPKSQSQGVRRGSGA